MIHLHNTRDMDAHAHNHSTHRGLQRGLLDRAGVWVSASCLVHCIATAILLSVPGLIGSALHYVPMLETLEHIFLALALAIAGFSLFPAYLRHRVWLPLCCFALGASAWFLRAWAHGVWEVVLTSVGVLFVAGSHMLNMQADRAHCC